MRGVETDPEDCLDNIPGPGDAWVLDDADTLSGSDRRLSTVCNILWLRDRPFLLLPSMPPIILCPKLSMPRFSRVRNELEFVRAAATSASVTLTYDPSSGLARNPAGS